MAAFTSKATGNWSSGGQTTWNEVGVPGSGDTVSIAAHTITVDVDTTVGTSPNDITTRVVDLTSASSVLTVGAGVTLTVLGNRGCVNGSTFRHNAGSTVTFDNSASGGSPVYRDLNGGFTNYVFAGTTGLPATVQAISGQTFLLNTAWASCSATFMTLRRQGGLNVTSVGGAVSITDSVFDSCALLNFAAAFTTTNLILERTVFQNSTNATETIRVDSGVFTSGTRRIVDNVFDKDMTYTAIGFTITGNYFGRNIEGNTNGRMATFENNIVVTTGNGGSGGGCRFNSSIGSNYFLADGGVGNPHYVALYAMDGNVSIDSCVFEEADPIAVDAGDCIFPYTNGPYTVTVIRNITIPNSVDPPHSSGVLVTIYSTDADRTVECYHNTVCNTNGSSSAAFNVAEGGTGHAGELAALKSNLVWSSNATGTLVSRLSGTVNGIVTAAGADYNWRWNGSDGDNGRGYNDSAGNLDLWTGAAATTSSAANSNVDNNQGTGNPQFLDSTRNISAWAAAHGYGATLSDGLAALRADTTLIPDLITWVREGFQVQNIALKDAGHDGVTIGAMGFIAAGVGRRSWAWFTDDTRRGEIPMIFNKIAAVTTSDAVNIPEGLTDAIYVGGTGNLVVVFSNDLTATLTNVQAGSVLPITVKRINSTNTTATSISALYQE